MSSILDSISKTSLLTAAMRAVETNRTLEQGRLFSDPYAEILAGDEGKNILEKAIKASGDQPAIAIRTRFVDDKMSAAIKNGCRQIVILASGMDTRAYRLNFSQDICIFELDREEVLNYKSEKLLSLKPKSVEPHSHLISIPVDLKTDWTSSLVKAGFKKSEKTFWLVEGLLMYLHEEDVITLFNRINSLVSKDDRLVFDILSQSLLESPFMKNQLQFLKDMGAPWNFGMNDPQKFMEKLNWKTVLLSQAGDYAPTRWPFPVIPMSVSNAPRGFFVEAVKV